MCDNMLIKKHTDRNKTKITDFSRVLFLCFGGRGMSGVEGEMVVLKKSEVDRAEAIFGPILAWK